MERQRLDQISSVVSSLLSETLPTAISGDIRAELSVLKAFFVSIKDEDSAKRVWICETTLAGREQYLQAYSLLTKGNYRAAWDALADCENTFRSLVPHVVENTYPLVDRLERVVRQFQMLFPYTWFASAELVVFEQFCSICDEPITIHWRCQHIPGEIYAGEQCMATMGHSELGAVGWVRTPKIKHCVADFPWITYDYSLVEYVMNYLQDPFDDWSLESTTREVPMSDHPRVRRNALCPCGSEEKYKRCCIGKASMLEEHFTLRLSDRYSTIVGKTVNTPRLDLSSNGPADTPAFKRTVYTMPCASRTYSE